MLFEIIRYKLGYSKRRDERPSTGVLVEPKQSKISLSSCRAVIALEKNKV